MVEPWVTFWSRFVYGRLHHEPFHPESVSWSFPSSGPLSGANIAIPWIVFSRDRTQFEKEYPELQIEQVRPFLQGRYLLSGGGETMITEEQRLAAIRKRPREQAVTNGRMRGEHVAQRLWE